MTKTQKTAALWFVGGFAMLVAGILSSEMRPMSLLAGVLFFAVGLRSIVRA